MRTALHLSLRSDNGMLLASPDAQVDLSVVGYQFPSATDQWDGNWLTIRGRVAVADREWSFDDPCLLTSEAQELGAWLMRVTNPDAEMHPLTFTEPNLR